MLFHLLKISIKRKVKSLSSDDAEEVLTVLYEQFSLIPFEFTLEDSKTFLYNRVNFFKQNDCPEFMSH